MKDKEILDILMDYIRDDRYNQAVLIDGDWGSGKTYFVQNSLLPELRKGTIDKKTIYVSLYGLKECNQIIDEIGMSIINDFLEKNENDNSIKKVSKGVGRGITSGAMIATKVLKSIGKLDSAELPNLSDIKEIKDIIIILDDLERCDIEINELFGFLNNLVEHNNIKVIIVANQNEIGRRKISTDLPQKYLIALDKRLNLGIVEEKNEKAHITEITKDDLISRTRELFIDDMHYEAIKEKLIGLTIKYTANLDDVYEAILNKYIKVTEVKVYLENNKELILDIFKNSNHYNLRTLIFAILCYERLFEDLNEIGSEILEKKLIEIHLSQMLKYTIELAVRIKRGDKIEAWGNNSDITPVYFENWRMNSNYIVGYKFIFDYLLHHSYNKYDVIHIMKNKIEEEKATIIERGKKDALAINKLYDWFKYEDDEVCNILEAIKGELKDNKYDPRYFKDIIVYLMKLEYYGWEEIRYKEYIELMYEYLLTDASCITKEILEVYSSDSEFKEKYEKIIKSLIELIDNKEKEKKIINNSFLAVERILNEDFPIWCKTNNDILVLDRKFLFYINVDGAIERLKAAKTREVYNFLEGIKNIYSFSNLNDIFKNDVEAVKSLIGKIDIEWLSNGGITKRVALEELKSKLEKSLELLKK